nr:MAG TPA: restriction enzyme [Bacteriophage sp.]
MNFKFNIGEEVVGDFRHFVVLEREIRDNLLSNGRIQKLKWYKLLCKKCGWDGCYMNESNLTKGCGCSCCHGRTVVEGINDIPTTAPWMVKYFQGGHDEAKLYTQGSGVKLHFVCPDCGNIKDKEVQIYNLFKNQQLPCPCKDGFSYPEKIVHSLLSQCNVKFISQVTKTTLQWAENYRYDFYIPALNMIIETHGMQHYRETGRGRPLIEEQKNDKVKKQLAKDNGIEHYIVLDCRKSELGWIKSSVLNSDLKDVLNLSLIDWDLCQTKCKTNILVEVCIAKTKQPYLTTTEIATMFGLNCNTVRNYLKRGVHLNLVEYNPLVEKQRTTIKMTKKNYKPVNVYKDGIQVNKEPFASVKHLSEISHGVFNTKLSSSAIASVCRGERKTHKGFSFKYADQ